MNIEYKASGIATVSPGVPGQGNGNLIKGFMTVFNTPDLTNEMTKPGAFKETIQANPHPPLLWSHDVSLPPVGVVRHWAEVTDGVYFVAELASTSMGEDLKKLVQQKALSGVSYGFRTLKEGVERRNGQRYRTLERCDVAEISLCNFPALPAARLIGEEGKEMQVIGETECLQACGVQVSKALLLAYVNALSRQADRKMKEIQNTRDTLLSVIECELKELDVLNLQVLE